MSAVAIQPEDSGERPEQLTFEGVAISGGTRFSLLGSRHLVSAGPLRYGEHVSGRFEGRVSGIRFVELRGELVRVHDIEVLFASLDE